MPVRETDKRNQELRRLEARRDQLVKALRDQDWVERLSENADFKKYLERVGEAQKVNVDHRAEVVEALSQPLPKMVERGQRLVQITRDELNEQLLLISATIDATAMVTNWPKDQEARLDNARKELPIIEEQIKDLKGGE